MKLFSRIIMVIALLSVLAFGSYAFGKYVLSSQLFGEEQKEALEAASPTVSENPATTRATGWRGAKPRVEVKVLPSEQDNTNLPSFSDEVRSKSKRSRQPLREAKELAPSSNETEDDFYDDARTATPVEEDKPKSKPRRRRRTSSSTPASKPKPKASTETRKTESADSASQELAKSESATPIPTRRDVVPRNQSSASPTPKSSASTTESRPRQQRPRETERASQPASASPIPRPEGSLPSSSSSGDSANISPVPRPE